MRCNGVVQWINFIIVAELPASINPEAVFANNEMDLAQVDVYGFDYDYTLAGYSDSLQYTIFEMGKQSLLKTKNVSKAD